MWIAHSLASPEYPKIKKLLKKEKKYLLPTEEDLTGAVHALVRLKLFYALPMRELRNGKIYNVQSSASKWLFYFLLFWC